MQRFGDGRDWFFARRFGLFVHWGLYAIPAWHEQVQQRRGIPKADYVALMSQFNPKAFDPDGWLDVAQAAGMGYVTFTAKHHDGFCMWDTAFTAYNVMRTPYGRDVVGILADACRRRGMVFNIYYSCPDWHHRNAINQGGSHQLPRQNSGDTPDQARYIAYVRNQARELCANYGPLGAFFWDIPPGIHDPSINAMLRWLQPGMLINDRGYDTGDFDTPEREVPAGRRFSRPTEACQSVGEQSWGYRADEHYHAHGFLMRSMDSILAMGGNYLLNVGPRADGTLPPEGVDAVQAVGAWYGSIRESVEGAEPCSHWIMGDRFLATRKGQTLYIHCRETLESSGLLLAPLDTLPRRATLLNTGMPLQASVDVLPRNWQERRPALRVFGIPVDAFTGRVPVLKLEFDDLDAVLDGLPVDGHLPAEDRG